MLDKMSDTSRIVDRLILKKLVQKSVCPHDKRLVDVIITEAGLKVLASIDELSDEIDGIIQNLSSDEALELNNLLDKLRQNHSN
jgi:DNA-binding MarR family transcriptional regulator